VPHRGLIRSRLRVGDGGVDLVAGVPCDEPIGAGDPCANAPRGRRALIERYESLDGVGAGGSSRGIEEQSPVGEAVPTAN
jgi:hypothetical protein